MTPLPLPICSGSFMATTVTVLCNPAHKQKNHQTQVTENNTIVTILAPFMEVLQFSSYLCFPSDKSPKD